MTREQAEAVAKFIQDKMDPARLWSISVSETRKVNPDAPTKYRIVIEPLGCDLPIAIYSARVLSKPQAKDSIP